MKFSLPAEALADTALWAARATSANPTNPLLSGILLEAKSGELSISGYDNESSGFVSVPAEVFAPGRVLVHASTFSNVAKGMPKGKPVDVEVVGQAVVITSGRSKYRLQLMQADSYPDLPTPPARSGTVDGEAFAQAVQRGGLAVSKDYSLTVLTGVLVEVERDTITFLSCDRYRMSLSTVPWNPVDPDAWDGQRLLVKPSSLEAVTKSVAGELTIHIGENTIGFTNGPRVTTSTLMDAEQYPAIRQFLSVGQDAPAVTFDVREMVDAVTRASIVLPPKEGIFLDIEPGESVTISSGLDDTGEEVVAAEYQGDKMRYKLNPGYLLEGLRGLTGFDTAILRATPAGKPLLLELPEDDTHRQVIMPVHVNK